MRGKQSNIFASLDWGVLTVYFLLVFLGISNIYAAVYDPDHAGLFDLETEHGKQIMWFGVSLFLGLIILFLEGNFIRKYAYWIYGGTIFLLIAVLFTSPINGARSWFGFGGVGIQPSEFAKVGVALALARFIDQNGGQKERNRVRKNAGLATLWGVIPFISKNKSTAFILALPCVLVLLQPDAGTFIVFTSFLLVLYREGYAGNILLFLVIGVIIAIITLLVADNSFLLPFTKIKLTGKTGIIITLVVLTGVFALLINSFVMKRNRKSLYRSLFGSFIVAVLFVNFVELGYSNVLQTHQKERIDLVLGKIEDPNGKGYNINRAKAAIGSGGFAGKGFKSAALANASQRHVPMQSTDFIFCTWSEERGFLGSAFLIILYTFLLVKIVIIGERQRSIFTRVYAYCVGSIFFYHFMINVGMAIGLAPVIGIPLPFFSYGGSSIMAFSLLLFILLKLDSERKIVLQ
ncbi:rod shape-determining protein RodA [Crocinitomicaceae bacterium]|jgi:rod shape determining protein RodA|nr:rod shape-determining protein RodA [Crocinitomicaceae bacterium]